MAISGWVGGWGRSACACQAGMDRVHTPSRMSCTVCGLVGVHQVEVKEFPTAKGTKKKKKFEKLNAEFIKSRSDATTLAQVQKAYVDCFAWLSASLEVGELKMIIDKNRPTEASNLLGSASSMRNTKHGQP